MRSPRAGAPVVLLALSDIRHRHLGGARGGERFTTWAASDTVTKAPKSLDQSSRWARVDVGWRDTALGGGAVELADAVGSYPVLGDPVGR
jgi:hypothetical protein